MNSLPPGWRIATLDELKASEPRSITDGPFGSNLTSAHYTSDGARVVRLQNIGDGIFNDTHAYISMQHFERLRNHEVFPGDLLITSLGEELPRACIAPASLGPAIVKADCIRVRLGERSDPRWAMYAMQTPAVRRWAKKHLHGVGRPRLGLKVIRQIPVVLPPLEEQHRILEILEGHLSRLDASVSGLEHVARRIDILEAQAIRAALAGRAVAGPYDVQIRAAGLDDGELATLPRGWDWMRLAELADVVGGVTKDSNKQSDPSFIEVPYLRVANVQRGHLDLREITSIRVSPRKAEILRLLPGDVLLNEGGDRDKLGRGWVWEGQVESCIHQNHVFRARIRNGRIDPYLLSWAATLLEVAGANVMESRVSISRRSVSARYE